MNTVRKEFYQVSLNGRTDCNNRQVYELFNKLTGLHKEFEIDQDYGTGCYGICTFDANDYPTLEEFEERFKLIDDMDDDALEEKGYSEYIELNDVYNYLRRKGELPEADILFRVDY